MGGGFGDGQVGGTETHYPKDGASGIDKEPGGFFLYEGELAVGEQVAHQLGALHAKGMETVSLLPMA